VVTVLDMPFQAYDISTMEGRDQLRTAINALGAATNEHVQMPMGTAHINISYNLCVVPPSSNLDSSAGLDVILLGGDYFRDPNRAGHSIGDLIARATELVGLAEGIYGSTGLDAEIASEFPYYIGMLMASPQVGLAARCTAEPL
jgi:hypothetical protein